MKNDIDSQDIIKESKLIYKWEVPRNCHKVTKGNNTPNEYRVYANDKYEGGIIVFALWFGEWEVNPVFAMRPFIKHLVGEIKGLKK